jgi:hypothetical protein
MGESLMTLTALEAEVARIIAAVLAMPLLPERARHRIAAHLIIRATERLI